jgi:hypothetical protein
LRAFLRRRRRSLILTGGALVVLTTLAAVQGNPAGPLDARTGEWAEGFTLEFPASGAFVEPLASLGHALAGAPDWQVAAKSTLVWAALLSAGVCLALEARRRPRRRTLVVALRAAGAAAVGAGVFVVYVAFCLAVRLPSWRLVAESSDLIVADLQTHTFGSHDGLIDTRSNLEWHAARGCDVVAVTEHDDPRGAVEARALAESAPDLPAVIPGAEVWWTDAFLLALNFERGPSLPWRCRREDFIGAIHRGHGGAVLALAWRVAPDGAHRLAEEGVDGFEIANLGHPDMPEEVRGAILDEAERRGLVLVSSSDWHGWGGFWRTWTAVRASGAASMSRRERAEAVVRALRERRAGDVIPLVAGRVGPPSTARAVFAPFAELVRYARELSGWRVLGWWFWAVVLLAAAEGLAALRLHRGRVFLAAFLAVLGAGMIGRGAILVAAWARGATSTAFPAEVGAKALALGAAALAAGVVIALLDLRRRRREAAGIGEGYLVIEGLEAGGPSA